MSRERGELALVLHAHMPYVEGFDTWPFGEEWLFEAVASCYLRLLPVVRAAPVTLGVTPVLCDQLEALRGPAGRRLVRLLREVRAPLHERDAGELERAGRPELAEEVRRAAGDLAAAERAFTALGGDLVGALRAFTRDGSPELWTSTATHAVVPLLATSAGARLQLATGVEGHRRRFGGFGGGLWLPECAYDPGLERLLAEQGARAFCVDRTALEAPDALAHLEPVATVAGPVAVPLDWTTTRLVWEERRGYPAGAAYRNRHRRTSHGLLPWDNAGRPYRHRDALALARAHARHFVGRVRERLGRFLAERGRPGLVCSAFDAELLGHWWYEGPEWLSAVLEESERQGVALASLPEALDRHPPVARTLQRSSWGAGRDLSTWEGPVVTAPATAARRAELRVVAAAARARRSEGERAALARAARELLALQASDWTFLMSRGEAGDYPARRVAGHGRALDEALRALEDSAPPPEPALRHLAPALRVAPLLAP